MEYHVAEELEEYLRDLFKEQITIGPELTETVKPDVIIVLLETMRFLGIAKVEVQKDGTLDYSALKGNAPIIIEEKKKRKESGKVFELLQLLDKVNEGTMMLSEVEIFVAETFLDEGKIDDVMDTLEILDKTPISNEVPSNAGRLSRIRGAISYFQADFEASARYFNDGAQKCELADDMQGVALNLLGYGNTKAVTGNFDQAFTTYDRAYVLFREKNDLKGMAKIKVNQAYFYSKMGHLKDSNQAHEEAIHLLLRLDDKADLQLAYSNRSAVLLTLGQHKEAYETTMGAYYLSTETSNNRMFHIARLTMVHIDISAMKSKLDFPFITEALAYFRDIGSEVDLSFAYEVLVEYYIANVMYNEFSVAFSQMLAQYVQNKDSVGLVAAGIKLMRVMVIYQTSKELMKKAYASIKESLGDKKLIEEFDRYVLEFWPKSYQS